MGAFVCESAGRVRLSRSGNRQLNAALYRIAITQIAHPGRGQDYYRKLTSQGKTNKDALRCLKRRLSHTVFQALKADHQTAQPTAA